MQKYHSQHISTQKIFDYFFPEEKVLVILAKVPQYLSSYYGCIKHKTPKEEK